MTIIITVKAKESLHQRMDTLKPMSVTDHALALSRKSVFLFYVKNTVSFSYVRFTLVSSTKAQT